MKSFTIGIRAKNKMATKNENQIFPVEMTHCEISALVHEIGSCYQEAVSDGNNFSLLTDMAAKYITIRPDRAQEVFSLVRNYGNINQKLSSANVALSTLVPKATKILDKNS